MPAPGTHPVRGHSSCPGRCGVLTVTSPEMLLTRAEAAEAASAEFGAEVTAERIRTWERRGHLECEGLNEDGQKVYKAVEVAKAAHKLRGFTRVNAA
jgi:hypothetical protein